MPKLALTMACGPYDRTEALRSGDVQPNGIDLTYLAIKSPPEIWAQMVQKQSFDLSEMSLSLAMTLHGRDEFPFVVLPIFPSRLFRHGFITVNTNAGIKTPKDLNGKRVGLPRYRQTAAVWVKGILQHEYDVSLESIHWFEGGTNTPRVPHVLDVKPEGPASLQFAPEGKSLNGMLEQGELDAVIGAVLPRSLGVSPHVQRLFPNYRELERDYYRRTGIFPIMHTLVVKEGLLRDHPWIAESIFNAMDEAKEQALVNMRFSGALRYMLPWMLNDLDDLEELFGKNQWPYGLEPNRATLETFLGYLVEQRLVPKPVPVDELFAPLAVYGE